jgi:hypothetical protein
MSSIPLRGDSVHRTPAQELIDFSVSKSLCMIIPVETMLNRMFADWYMKLEIQTQLVDMSPYRISEGRHNTNNFRSTGITDSWPAQNNT